MATSPAPGSPEELFSKGLASLEAKSFKQAAVHFQKAADLERDNGARFPKMKSISYLGLAMTLANGRSKEAVKLCEQAVKREFYDADLFCNLGIVYLRNRQRGRAFDAFYRGLKLKPSHRRILMELARHEKRGRPLLSFLSRDHPMNRMAGKIRARLRDLLGRNADSDR